MAEYCNDNFLMVEDNEDQFRFWQGLVGPHYTPILSNDGTLRWTNDGFLQNPDEVNIRGPQGAGLSIGGIRETEGELPATAPPGAIWLVGTEVPYEGYSYIGGEWVDLGPLSVGPAGPPGPQGDDYTLTEADKTEIADAAETVLLNELANNPLPLSRGGTGSQTLAGAQEILGITDLADQIGATPLATEAQDIRGAINELVGDLGSLDFDTEAQNVTGAVNELAADAAALEVLVVNMGTVTTLPVTKAVAGVTTDMVPIKATLGTPSAQTGNWTVNTNTAGSVTVSGSISGSTTLTLYLMKSR